MSTDTSQFSETEPVTHPIVVRWDAGGEEELQLTVAQADGVICVHCGERDGVVPVGTVPCDDGDEDPVVRACHKDCERVSRLEGQSDVLKMSVPELRAEVARLKALIEQPKAEATEPAAWGTQPDDAPGVEERRGLIELLAVDRAAFSDLTEQVGEDVMPYVLQAVCLELMHLGIFQVEHAEHHVGLDAAVPFLGGMVNGLMFDVDNEPLPGDDDLAKLRRIAARQGRAIREAAGVEAL